MSTPSKPSTRLIVVPGTGWPKGTSTECSKINQALLDSAVDVAQADVRQGIRSILVSLGGVGKTKDGKGMTESERARHYLAEKGLVTDVAPEYSEPADIVEWTRANVSSLLEMRTDCDPDFDGKPSRDTNENGDNLIRIIRELQTEGANVDTITVVALADHMKRARGIFTRKLDEAGLNEIPVVTKAVDTGYEPGNAQAHLRSRSHRVAWEVIGTVARFPERVLGEQRFGQLKNWAKKKLGLI
jgi:hypothetical protein